MSEINQIVTMDGIIGYLQDAVEEKRQIAPSLWLDAAQKLNVLLGDEEDELFELQQKEAQAKYNFILGQQKKNVSEAKAFIEASDEHKIARKQAAKIGRIVEFIRLAKVQSRMRMEEMRGS